MGKTSLLKKDGKCLYSWVILITCLVILISGFMVLSVTRKKLVNEFESIFLVAAKATDSYMNGVLGQIHSLVLSGRDILSSDNEKIYTYLQALESYDVINDAGIYCRQKNGDAYLIKKDGTILEIAQMPDYLQSEYLISSETLLSLLPLQGKDDILITGDEKEKKIIYIYTLATQQGDFVCLLAIVNFMELPVFEMQDIGSQIYIVDTEDVVCTLSNMDEAMQLDYDALKEGVSNYNGFICGVYCSSISNLKYVVFKRQDELLSTFRGLIIWLIAVFAGLGMLAYVISRIIPDKMHANKTMVVSVPAVNMEKTIIPILDKYRTITANNENYFGYSKYKSGSSKGTHLWYLEKIMLGVVQYDHLEEYYKFNLDFSNAVVFTLCRGGMDKTKVYYGDVFCFMLDSMCLEIFQEGFRVFFLELECKVVGVILDIKPCKTFLDDVVRGLDKLADSVKHLMSIDICYCISDIHHGFDKLVNAYNEANYTYTYYYIRSQLCRFSYYNDIKVQKCEYLDVPRIADVEKRFLGLIADHEFIKAKHELISLIDTLGSFIGLNNRVVQTAIFDIVDMTLKGLSILNQTDVERIFDKLALIEEMLGVDNMGYLKERCNYILDSLIQDFDTKSMNIDDKIAAAVSYIKVHYNDPDLSVGMISDIFSISAQHLSKNFKEYQGIGAQDYIMNLRIDNAKKLLRHNKNLSVAKIANEVGFTNSQTFIRAFKRLEGITPGQLRDQYAHKTND